MDSIKMVWPGGEHDFALRLGELRKMQDSCNAGPGEVLERLRSNTFRVDDLIEPIRLGLIGGGMSSGEAGPLVTKVMQQVPLAEFQITAAMIVAHALYGPVDDMPKKSEGVTQNQESGSSQTSMETEAL